MPLMASSLKPCLIHGLSFIVPDHNVLPQGCCGLSPLCLTRRRIHSFLINLTVVSSPLQRQSAADLCMSHEQRVYSLFRRILRCGRTWPGSAEAGPAAKH